MRKEYKTIYKEAVAEYEEKKSKFICHVKPVIEEQQALDFLANIKKTYRDASHNVYGYFISTENIIQRFSDDGEPSGTAGLPTMEVIKRTEVRNLIIVTTRYFGGTRLGAAGLIRAYGKSASLGIEAGEIVRNVYCYQVKIMVEYSSYEKIKKFLFDKEHIIVDTVFLQDIEIAVCVPTDTYDLFQMDLIELTNANILIEKIKDNYITVNKEGKFLTIS